ncbi:iron ABC transporter [Bacillus sp. V3-13]|uniref:FecCD family ABC transporter permease n=1 Tax=Bacillus sp. V3-13 TaxID=2053728 RepID=UPI000C78FED2|nr:iron ABC transporter permease [Bacillus sp. V3-13]PLR79305.1 iron ABC transporter [Bacillus sp. V3-13]
MLFKNNWQKWTGLVVAIIILLLLMCASIVYGYTDTSWQMAIDAFANFNGSNEHIIIQSVRVPRAFIAAAVGASLAISGVLMQTLTKNPLASPDIFGVNAGAGALVVIAVTIFSIGNLQLFTWVSFAGAAIAAVSVYAVGSIGREGLTPMKLTLAGAAMTAMFASFTQGLLVLNEAALEQVLFWLAGSVSGRKLENLTAVLPYLAAGWIVSLVVASKMNVLSMGEDVAKGLGLNTAFIKISIGVIVILLAGGSVAVAGPIGFIGIVVPHLTRSLVGIDHRWLIPFSGILGGVLLVAADIASRYILMPQEVPVGVMTAIIGTPFFIYIARKGFNGR